ncbi:MAG: hypothetical protein DRI56_12070 [Chloroflexota bacterium]|nr:MAG: hypothetical protein DRI56_12070 [Chloroflexota bacterium]
MAEKLLSLNKRHLKRISSSLAGIACLILIFFLLITVVLYPTTRRVLRLRHLIAKTQEENQQIKTKIENIKKAEAQFPNYQTLITSALEKLPNEPRPLNLTHQLVDTAAKNALSLDTVRYFPSQLNRKEKQFPSSLSELLFTVDGSGSYSNIKSYLKDLEKGERKIVIRSLVLKKEESSANLGFEIQGSAFWQKSAPSL